MKAMRNEAGNPEMRRILTPAELHPAPVAPEAPRGMERQLQAWAFVVRTSVEVIQALTDEIGERERALERWLRSPRPDPAAIGTLVLEIRARRLEIERIIGSLPTLEGVGQRD